MENLPKQTTFLITLGGTSEPIDSVRSIANGSTGKMGLAIIKALLEKSKLFNVNFTIIAVVGTNTIQENEWPREISKIDIKTANQMCEVVMKNIKDKKIDIFISVAAVGDFKIKDYSKEKIKKNENEDEITLTFIKNPDILKSVSSVSENKRPFSVGFALETGNLKENAMTKYEKKKLDMIVINNANAIGSNNNEIMIIDTKKNIAKYKSDIKENIGKAIVDKILQNYVETLISKTINQDKNINNKAISKL